MAVNPNQFQNYDPKNDPRKADDSKNFMMFILVSLILLFVFDSYVMQPKLAKLQEIEDIKNGKTIKKDVVTKIEKAEPKSRDDVLLPTVIQFNKPLLQLWRCYTGLALKPVSERSENFQENWKQPAMRR
ncbi:MAG: hypothetical protein AAF331_13295 [Pseudomonadota bacterium]